MPTQRGKRDILFVARESIEFVTPGPSQYVPDVKGVALPFKERHAAKFDCATRDDYFKVCVHMDSERV